MQLALHQRNNDRNGNFLGPLVIVYVECGAHLNIALLRKDRCIFPRWFSANHHALVCAYVAYHVSKFANIVHIWSSLPVTRPAQSQGYRALQLYCEWTRLSADAPRCHNRRLNRRVSRRRTGLAYDISSPPTARTFANLASLLPCGILWHRFYVQARMWSN